MSASEDTRRDADSHSMARRDFLKTSAVGAGAVGTVLGASSLLPGQVAEPAPAAEDDNRMKIGVNLEYVRHADKSLTYGVQTAGKMGYKYVEPCFLMGRCLLSNAGYCHVTSLDTDPLQILDLCTQAGVKISGLSSHSDLLNPEWGVLYARRGIRYARALGVNIVQITEDMYPPKWMTEQDAYSIMKINLLAIAETCEENGVYIAVEQHGPYTAKIKSLTRILELVDSPWIQSQLRLRQHVSRPAKTPMPCSRPSSIASSTCTPRTSRANRPPRNAARSRARPSAVRAAMARSIGIVS